VLDNVLNYLINTKNYSWHHACSLQPENLLSVNVVFKSHIACIFLFMSVYEYHVLMDCKFYV
jgi:hypothetical protein